MMYFTGSCNAKVPLGPGIGLLVQPRNWASYRHRLSEFPAWAADTGLYRKDPARFDTAAWLDELSQAPKEGCAFVTARDMYMDPIATTEFLRVDAPLIRRAGFKVAYIAQNGATCCSVPWHLVDVLFLGGDTKWKLSEDARVLVREAKKRGLRAHMGRVNSERRYRLAASWGCDSADGTLLAFGHNVNFPRLRAWVDQKVMVFG